jgi:peptidyl-prolyl cis-trans isomerase C
MHGAHSTGTKEDTDTVSAHCRWVIIFAVVFSLLGPLQASAQNGIVARVNGKAITETDMGLADAEIGSDFGSLPTGIKRRVLAEFLIENQLFAEAAEAQKLAVPTPAKANPQYWQRRALRDAYFDKSIVSSVSEGEVKAFYDEHVGSKKAEEEVRARHILVASKDKARELFEKIAHGSSFAELAKQNSIDPGSKEQGGDLGFFGRGQMVPQFEEAAFRLKPGEVSQPFETQFGWHIIQVDARRERQVPAFEAIKDRVRAAVIHHKAQQIVLGLRSKAQIEYVDPEIKKLVESERTGATKK